MIHSLNRKHDTRVTDASPDFLAGLQERNWEGNVRELRNIVERAVILAGSGTLRPSHVPYGLRTPQTADAAVEIPVEPVAPPVPDPGTVMLKLGTTIDEAERVLIEATLTHTGMNKTRAAAILGITTKTLHTKLRQYSLATEDNPGEDEPAPQTASSHGD
jgi:DNA-binding NtrC family response regulator